MAFNKMEFGTNDDRDISNLLANADGSGQGYYITFVNIILTKSLSILYEITGNYINWYVLLSMVLCFCALTVFCYMIIMRTENIGVGLAISVVLVGALYTSHYITFQFTQNAVLLTMIGTLLIVDSILQKKESISILCCFSGIVATVMGSMIRFQSVFFVIPYAIFLVIYILSSKRKFLWEWITEHKIPLLSMVICLVLVVGTRYIHIYKYTSTPELKDFYEENLLRVELLDYGFPDYEEHAEEIEALGISVEDIELFEQQCFLDKDVFTKEVLQALVDMKVQSNSLISIQNLKISSLCSIPKFLRDNWNIIWVSLIFMTLFLCFCATRKELLLTVISLVCMFLMLWYFISVDRIPFRIHYSIIAPALILIVYLCSVCNMGHTIHNVSTSSDTFNKLKWKWKVCVMLLVLANIWSLRFICLTSIANDEDKITSTYENILDLAEEYPDTIILLDRPTVSGLTYNSTISPLTALPAGSQSNVCIQGGWICWTPANLSVLSSHGISNIYEEIGNGMEVILVDGRTPELKLSFIQRHYNSHVQLEQIGTVQDSDIGIYRFYLK